MSQSNHDLLVDVAKAEDTYSLLQHIAWTDVIEPQLFKLREQYSKALVNHLLGSPLPEGLTKEQLAGKIYGIDFISTFLKSVISRGEKALAELNSQGISLK